MRIHHKCGCVETNDGTDHCPEHDHSAEIERLNAEIASLRARLDAETVAEGWWCPKDGHTSVAAELSGLPYVKKQCEDCQRVRVVLNPRAEATDAKE